MAAVLHEARALRDGAARCEELMQIRRAALQKAEALLPLARQEAEVRAQTANAERTRLSEELEAIGRRAGTELVSDGLGEESIRLEDEVNGLQERKKDLKAELERLGRQHDDAIARQKAHMTQVDCWRMDKEKVKETTVKSKEDTLQEGQAAAREQARGSRVLESLQGVQSNLQEASSRSLSEAEAAAQHTDENVLSSAVRGVAATEDRLTSALAAAREVLTEHRRAKSTLELLDVQAPTTDLPTLGELAKALGTLHDAWAARVTLGSVDLTRRAEVESFLREASGEGAGPDGLAEAKATWTQRWGEMGDLAILLANAAAGGGSKTLGSISSLAASLNSKAPPEPQMRPLQHQLFPSLDDDEDALLA
mmetsp:Transcript_81855/g.222151  ORF Transcript_81855/g.222151 Transcript_81855/m.222151 type:complete len:367 (+) Transcript_81855:1-1101(+)